ncbi:MAG: hypothetical protein MI717_08885, partial [Spirochaetales bacterium]|nr:hypothetical protein [Spirochaetales bacterium]
NASEELKGKMKLLEGMIGQPTYGTLKSNFEYREIVKDPLVFENCYVLWSGRATNIEYGEEKITFDFLVGYENETVLEGIVFAEVPFQTVINGSTPLEILAQIRYRNGKIILTAVSLRPILK